MRTFLAGILLLLLCPGIAQAQIKAQVEDIGFNKVYRPDAHTPMLVSITPENLKTGYYQIQVHQKDLDGHDVVYSKLISLTGTDEGAPRQQRFRLDFLPSPQGLPDPNRGETLADLQKELHVFLCEKNGKQIAPIAVRDSIMSLDPPPSVWSTRRGAKLILAVTDGRSQPASAEYGNPADPAQANLLGVLEDVTMMQVRADNLPENPVEYDAVDAIVWFNVDPAELKRAGGDAKYRALESWVKQGGHLVICQSPEWQKTAEFGDLLPVTLQGVEAKGDLWPLRKLADSKPRDVIEDKQKLRIADPWAQLSGPFQIARATAKPGAIVDEWIDWDGKADRTPYIVRKPYGLGAVTWVAQDLGDPALTSKIKTHWVNVWDKVFDLKNSPLVIDKYTTSDERIPYQHAGTVDLGKSLIQGMEAKSKASLFIATAVAFFLIYWAVAGPGFYVYLVSKRRANLSWFMFGLSALGATALTVLIVKLVLRGPPEVHHISLVQQAANQPAVVRSRFGLYIPRDGDQKLAMQNTLPQTVSTISGFAIHPAYLDRDANTSVALEYQVPVREPNTTDPPALTVPYQSTLKKFEATWIGESTSGSVDGSAKMLNEFEAGRKLDGRITNGTGKQLRNIYIAFKYLQPNGEFEDYLYYLPAWEPGVSIDLGKEFTSSEAKLVNADNNNVPEAGKKLQGRISKDWQQLYWDRRVKSASGIGDGFIGDSADAVPKSIPIMSFFDRLSPLKNDMSKTADRVEILRRGGRHLDRSSALAAGAMVVLAQADGPLPFPMTVEGDPVTGSGTTFYQYVLPIDRTAVEKPTTQQAQ